MRHHKPFNDPLSLLGKKISSAHCRGKKEKIVRYCPRLGFSSAEIVAICDCGGWTSYDETGSFKMGTFGPGPTKKDIARDEREWQKKLLRDPALGKLVRMLETQKHRPVKRITTEQEFQRHGWFFSKDVKKIDSKLWKRLYPTHAIKV